MNPSPSAVAWIDAQSPDWSQSDAAIFATIGALTAPNPVSVAPQVPGPFTALGALALVSGASLAKLFNVGLMPTINAAINAGDRAGLTQWATAAAADALITGPEASAIAGYAAATVPDPTWSATVPAALVALERPLDVGDITAARAAGGH